MNSFTQNALADLKPSAAKASAIGENNLIQRSTRLSHTPMKGPLDTLQAGRLSCLRVLTISGDWLDILTEVVVLDLTATCSFPGHVAFLGLRVP